MISLRREEILVNAVACPTKLVEYMYWGVVPVVITPNIGDFMNPLIWGMVIGCLVLTAVYFVRRRRAPEEEAVFYLKCPGCKRRLAELFSER